MTKYYVVGIFDCSAHAKNNLELYEVEADNEENALQKAFFLSPISKEKDMTYGIFTKKIKKRFAVNFIEI